MSTIQKILALQALNACKKESCMGGGGACSKGKCNGSCSSKSNCNHIG